MYLRGTRRSLRRLALAVAALVISGCVAVQPQARGSADGHTVILVSLDGFRRDYLERYSPPTLLRLAAEGAIADAMIPSFPTNTFPNHYTIVTGLYPANHGIVHNTMFDPQFNARFTISGAGPRESRWFEGEPIWVTAEKQGVRSAAFFWVGSEVEIAGTLPSRWQRYDGRVPYSARVDSVLSWLDLPAAERPRMIALYFEEPDQTGHDDGPDAPTVRAAVLKSDSALARLVDGLRDRELFDSVNLVVVSDHGMAELSPDRVVYLSDVVDTGTVRVVTTAGMFMGWSRTGDNAGLVAALRRLPHVSAWLKEDIPARFHFRDHRRITPVVALADEGWRIMLGRGSRLSARGGHGYDNALSSMQAIFIARGPVFRRGARVPAFQSVDVYPLLTHILGLRPAASDGSLASLSAALR